MESLNARAAVALLAASSPGLEAGVHPDDPARIVVHALRPTPGAEAMVVDLHGLYAKEAVAVGDKS
jgi:hypothetical protein